MPKKIKELTIVGAIKIIKDMGHIIRHLDGDNEYLEYWTNDGNEHGGDYNLYLKDYYGID